MPTSPFSDDDIELTLAELCQAAQLPAERIIDFIETGVIEPQGRQPTQWRFSGVCVRRVTSAVRIQKDLGVNEPGLALVLDLVQEIETLRRRLQRLED